MKFAVDMPFLFFLIAGYSVLFYIYFYSRIAGNFKLVIFNIAVIMLILSFIEAGAIVSDRVLGKKYIGRVVYVPDSVRGYCPKSNQRSPSKCLQNGRVLYDVVYTINRFGLRIAPHDIQPVQSDSNVRRALFFGCSFLFGVGVNDNETFPFIYENNSHGKYLAYNFGLPGSGPHQMLALLESGVPDQVLEGQKPVVAFYQALPCHIQRASFKAYTLDSQVDLGPKYYLDPSNRLLLRKEGVKQPLNMLGILGHSVFLKDSLLRSGIVRNESDRKLFVAIVKRSKEIFESRYGGKFYVIYWDCGDSDDREVIEALRNEHIQVFPVSAILGEYQKIKDKYFLKEGHPNKLAYQALAQYFLNLGKNDH